MKQHTYWILGVLALVVLSLSVVYKDSSVLFLIGTIELVLIAIVVNTFVLVYSQQNWRANPYGRALMYSKVSLAVLCNLSIATAIIGPDWEWRAVVRVLLFGGILIAQSRLLQLLFWVRAKDAKDKEALVSEIENRLKD